jgi:hypothetical protein
MNIGFKNFITGIPTLAYGFAARFLIKFSENVETSKGIVVIYFLNEEDVNSKY